MDYRKQAEINNDLFRTSKAPSRRLSLSLPLPPSVNKMYTMKKTLTAKAQTYIRASRALINLAIDEQYWSCVEPPHWLYLDLVFYMPDRKIRDSHNMLKLLLDVMQGLIYENDYYVLPRIQSVEYDKENPRVAILVSHQRVSERDKSLHIK